MTAGKFRNKGGPHDRRRAAADRTDLPLTSHVRTSIHHTVLLPLLTHFLDKLIIRLDLISIQQITILVVTTIVS